MSRSHPDGDPGGDDPREQLRQFKKDNVRVMITDLSSDLSKMMTEFEGAYNDKDTSAPGAFKLTRLKLHSDPTADVDEFVKAVSEDIKSTLMVSAASLLAAPCRQAAEESALCLRRIPSHGRPRPTASAGLLVPCFARRLTSSEAL